MGTTLTTAQLPNLPKHIFRSHAAPLRCSHRRTPAASPAIRMININSSRLDDLMALPRSLLDGAFGDLETEMDLFRSNRLSSSQPPTEARAQALRSPSDGLGGASQMPAMNDVIDTMFSGHRAMMNGVLRDFDKPAEMFKGTDAILDRKARSGEPYQGETYAMSFVSATGTGDDGKPHRAFESRHVYDNGATGEHKRAHARGIDDQAMKVVRERKHHDAEEKETIHRRGIPDGAELNFEDRWKQHGTALVSTPWAVSNRALGGQSDGNTTRKALDK